MQENNLKIHDACVAYGTNERLVESNCSRKSRRIMMQSFFQDSIKNLTISKSWLQDVYSEKRDTEPQCRYFSGRYLKLETENVSVRRPTEWWLKCTSKSWSEFLNWKTESTTEIFLRNLSRNIAIESYGKLSRALSKTHPCWEREFI